MRVLIVDDDRVSRALVRAVVDDEGHFAIEADSAEEAIPTIAAGEVDVVITDWQMAGMSGPELATYVRAAALDRYVYVILLTANNNPESLITGLNSGADDFVTKPFNLEELAVRLRVAQRVHPVRHQLHRVNVQAAVGFVQNAHAGFQHRHLEDLVALFLAAGKADVDGAL